MENKCFIEKLEVSSNNENLKEFGVIKFKINTNSNENSFNRLGGYDNNHPVTIECEDGGVKNYGTQDDYVSPFIAVGNSARTFITNSLSNIRIKDKYNLGYFKFSPLSSTSLDLSEFNYCTKLVDLSFGNNITLTNANLSYLWNCPELSSIDFEASIPISGDLVELVKHMIANGRDTEGSLSVFIINNSNISFGSFKFTSITSATTVNWQSATKLYLTQLYTSFIRCYGYTDAEISTNTATGGIWEGKTVTKCD